ncbi:hypothetical protein [Prosthecobacter sp.]|uniref:hypothetical protein n=1 Tax=Prosthecobacter sp. TaxID=1965333 RepID=UPI002ABB023A|nr:hypothetical protein [Prosthecobacter sp.]MDZ4401742.1 hypothetical protein [Prosthecobacter sp.]
MKQDSVFCIAFSRLQADQMVQRLKSEAFSIRDISVLSGTGPMMAALGDLVGGLQNQGVPWAKARLYADRMKDGRLLVSVVAESDDAVTLAKEVLSKAGGSDFCATYESSQPDSSMTTLQEEHPSASRLSFA